jgi:LmbE family N-acetylglucosaminyl deacetylase
MTAEPFEAPLSGDAPSIDSAPDLREYLADAILVVAHPDDEILWFSSVVSKVSRVIVVFSDDPQVPGLGRHREELFAAYPIETVELLGLTESCSFNHAGWPSTRRSPYGLELRAPLGIRDAYRRNYERLVVLLDDALANASVVLTHSPWGDYGHEDHVQVYAAVAATQRKHGFQIWYPGYVSDRSWTLMQEAVVGFSQSHITMNTDRSLAHNLVALYREHNCWTWYDDYEWPVQETFFLDAGSAATNTSLPLGGNFPVNVLRVALPRPTTRRRKFSRILKRLGRR